MNWLLCRLKGVKMFRCNVCGAIFDKPLEQHREVEYYSRPFGNESEPFGDGYYDCCPECESEDFDRYEEPIYRVVEDLQGGEFGMGRDFTIEEWREQAIEWAEMDEHYGIIETLKVMKKDNVIDFISEIWALRFEEV